MPEIVMQPLPALNVAARVLVVPADEVAETVEALFQEVQAAFGHAPGAQDIPIATYEQRPDGTRVVAGYVVQAIVPEGVEVVELDAVDEAACLEHHGAMADVRSTWATLHDAIAERGLEPSGAARERYVVAGGSDQSDWVVELQQPVRAR